METSPQTKPAAEPTPDETQPLRKKSFAEGLNFYKLFWIFFIGSFVGVVVELIFCFITRGHFESRSGLVYGPFNLVYGFGALFMTLGLAWLAKRGNFVIFLGGFAIGSIWEYVCSFVQESMFGTVSWEYSAQPFNLNGRISLLYSCFWGLLALAWIKWLYPFLSRLIERIPNRLGIILTWVLFVFMIFNTVVSALALHRMEERRDGIPATTAMQQILDERFPDERMNRIYANMQVVTEEDTQNPQNPENIEDTESAQNTQVSDTAQSPDKTENSKKSDNF